MFFVYVLLSEVDKRFYIGFTEDIQRRLKDHNSGKVTSTKKRKPLCLIYYEAYIDFIDAKGREKFLKSGSGIRFLNRQLSNSLNSSLKDRYRGVEQPGSSQGS